MAYSNGSVALCNISKALFKHRHGVAASAPFSAATATNTALNQLRVDSAGESGEAETMEEVAAAESSRVEVAYDATKGREEKVKETVIAEANENVVDTTEYRSMEDMGTIKTSSF